jgi:ATPase subunit of ABC transporter with duplicated ATPase domains
VQESLTSVSASENLKKVLLDYLKPEEVAAFESDIFPKVYADYHPRELKVLEDPENVLCHVDNLMLMYGGGHMLLKDTTLELRKGKRYGVLGRNGTGKSTLMNLLAAGNVPGVPKGMTTIHVNPHVLDHHMETKCLDFMAQGNPGFEMDVLKETLVKVEFPEHLWKSTIAELSGGWRMRLLIAEAMMKKADVLLLDEPTNHLDISAVKWLCDYLTSLDQSSIMVISHDPYFLNRVCTDIINYNKGKLVYYEGNFDAFISRMGISAGDAEAILSGNVGVGADGVEREEGAETPKSDNGEAATSALKNVDSAQFSTEAGDASETGGDETPTTLQKTETEATEDPSTPGVCAQRTTDPDSVAASGPDRKARISFPIPGKVKGITSLAKPVLEIDNLTWAYNKEKGDVIKGVSSKITMNSRIHIKGVNGAGKTSFMNLICGEIHPNASAMPQKGSVNRHRNCRLAYMAQQHMHHMKEFMNSSPYIYIQKRYQNGFDGALQQRLMEPANEEEREDRIARAKVHGKYGNMIKNLVGRQLRGKDMWYEAQWENCPDQKQNTWINMETLQKLGCESFALAYDDRAAAAEGGIDQRPLSQREITKHLELFGITEELALNRTIGMFSAGQKSKVSLAAAFWIKPHLVALDEPTNYIDMETLDALTTALQRFKGGVICISHCAEFAEKVCNETWFLEGGAMTIHKKDAKK